MTHKQQGMTLVELVIAIVVVSIAVTSVLGAMSSISSRSADPIILVQSQAIAESYMDEITAKAYTFPDANATCIGPLPTTKTRATFTLVCDYQDLLDTVPRNSEGINIAGLAAYTVAVAITKVPGTAEMSPATTPALDAVKIAVTVTSPKGPYTLVGYRTRY